MGRILFYGSFVIIIAIGSWYYYQGEKAPDALLPIVVLLFGVMSLGYGLKAKEDGDFGAGNRKIRRDKNPRLFQTAIYLNYCVTAALIVWSIYMVVVS